MSWCDGVSVCLGLSTNCFSGRCPTATHPCPRYFKLEQGNTAEQQEKADAAAAQAHFVQLGWPADDLRPDAGDESAGCDELLRALLKRAAALQEARQRGKPGVDWEQPEWK